jgi:FKBP-type peptidyl-prolyl cis-trans isomerase FklB
LEDILSYDTLYWISGEKITVKGDYMKLKLMVVLGILVLVSQVYAEENLALKTQKEKFSYLVGMDLGNNLKNGSIDVDLDMVVKGIQDGLAGKKSLLTEQETKEVMTTFQKDMMAKREEIAKKNKVEGDAFLAENKKKKDVVTLPSGLQYRILKPGKGKKPRADDTVVVNYKGTLIDGTEFDSSDRSGKPQEIPVNGVIRGWTEALQLMEEGSKWQVFIPSNLAYGERGARMIKPNSTLIFEIELLSVKEKKPEVKPEGRPETKPEAKPATKPPKENKQEKK